jgi:hypothetical protein
MGLSDGGGRLLGNENGRAEPEAVAQILAAARALIATPESWTTGTTARDADGRNLGDDERAALDEDAVRWCAGGAIMRAAGDTRTWEPAQRALERVIDPQRAGPFIGVWNDMTGRTHGEVLAAFDRAIQQAEGSR